MSNSNPKRQGGPRPRKSEPADGVQQIFHMAKYQQSFDREAFDALIQGQGIKVTHYRAIPDPQGMAALGDIHAVQSKRRSSDGFLYREVGDLHMFFNANTSDWQVEIEGLVKHDIAMVTFPIKYDSDPDCEVILSAYDRFYLKDIEVRVVAMQFVEANSTGVDRLQYPATCVEYIIDADGKEYTADLDFKINADGLIQWISQNRPGYNEKTSRGMVYSIRYRYTPYFTIMKMLHETRVSQITDPLTYDRFVTRMPFQALVAREQVLSDMNKDPNSSHADIRFQLPPSEGSTGTPGRGSEGGRL